MLMQMMLKLLAAAPEMGEVGEFFTHCFSQFDFNDINRTLPNHTFEGALDITVGDVFIAGDFCEQDYCVISNPEASLNGTDNTCMCPANTVFNNGSSPDFPIGCVDTCHPNGQFNDNTMQCDCNPAIQSMPFSPTCKSPASTTTASPGTCARS